MKNENLLSDIESLIIDEKSEKALTELVSLLKINKETKMPKALEEFLDNLKDNPIEEKEFSSFYDELLKKIKTKEIDADDAHLELALFVIGDEVIADKLFKDGVSLIEFSKLGAKSALKVFDLKYFDENEKLVFKEVESHKDMKVLSLMEIMKIKKAKNIADKKTDDEVAKTNKLLTKAQELQESKNTDKKQLKKLDEAIKKFTESVKTRDEKIDNIKSDFTKTLLGYAGLKQKDMTKWEVDLALAKILSMCSDEYTPPLGKN